MSVVARMGRPRAIPPRRLRSPVAAAPLDRPCEQEEGRGDEPVRDHLQERAREAGVVDRERGR